MSVNFTTSRLKYTQITYVLLLLHHKQCIICKKGRTNKTKKNMFLFFRGKSPFLSSLPHPKILEKVHKRHLQSIIVYSAPQHPAERFHVYMWEFCPSSNFNTFYLYWFCYLLVGVTVVVVVVTAVSKRNATPSTFGTMMHHTDVNEKVLPMRGTTGVQSVMVGSCSEHAQTWLGVRTERLRVEGTIKHQLFIDRRMTESGSWCHSIWYEFR